MVRRFGDLEIDQDLTFQRREWIAERIGWTAMALFVAAAVLGVFGAGWLSQATAEVPGRLRVEYQRFSRYQTAEQLIVHVHARSPEARIALARSFLDASTLESVTPSPLRVEGAEDRLVYVFAVARPEEPMKIVFRLQPGRFGVSHGRVWLEAEPAAGPPAAVAFRRLVYP